MAMVWSCGVIIAVKPIFSHEKFDDIGLFVEETLQRLPEYARPDVVFFDNACRLHPALKSMN